jgi:acyl-coenzyme A thioesterase PaaI-like protein
MMAGKGVGEMTEEKTGLTGLQASSRHCFVCGIANPYGLHMRFYAPRVGEVEAHITVPEQFQGYPGVVHGGIVAAMLDEVAGRIYMNGGDGKAPRFMFTGKLEIRYRKNVPVGKPLRLVGIGIKDNGRVASAKSFIFDETDTLLAEAEALLLNTPEELLTNVDLEALGWKVYPDNADERAGRLEGWKGETR